MKGKSAVASAIAENGLIGYALLSGFREDSVKALIVGIILAVFAVFAAIPAPGLGWWKEILFVLKGLVPLLALFIGVVAVLIGVADIKDSREAKKEAAEDIPDK